MIVLSVNFPAASGWLKKRKDVISFRGRIFIDYCLRLRPQNNSKSSIKDIAKCKLYAQILKTNKKSGNLELIWAGETFILNPGK